MLLVSSLPPLAVAGGLLLGSMALLGMGNGAVFQLVPQRFRRELGVMTGLVGAAGGVGGFLLSFLLGLGQDATGSYASGFLFFAVAALACVALITAVQESWQKTWAGEGGRASSNSPVFIQD